MLPCLSHLSRLPIGAAKRPDDYRDEEEELRPCPRELAYNDNELLNVTDVRVEGGDAKFSKMPIDGLPLEVPFQQSFEEVLELHGMTKGFTTVISELYRQDGPLNLQLQEDNFPRGEVLAYLEGDRQDVIPQYRLTTIAESATVVHMIEDAKFWNGKFARFGSTPEVRKRNRRDQQLVEVGANGFTNGILWTNPDPNWSYKTDDTQPLMRCRIRLPEGTQAIIDKSPVYGGIRCEREDGRISLFPDVLLPPGQFQVEDATYYRSSKVVWDKNDEEFPRCKYVYLTPGHRGIPKTDIEYAKRRLSEVDEFIDVRLAAIKMMRLPQVTQTFIVESSTA